MGYRNTNDKGFSCPHTIAGGCWVTLAHRFHFIFIFIFILNSAKLAKKPVKK
jgi:hypothetical protein